MSTALYSNQISAAASTDAAAGWKQSNWRWCKKCACLFFGGNAICAVGDVHDHSESGTYTVSNTAAGQPDWKWCGKCQALSFTSKGEVGPCPAGEEHSVSTSGNYRLQENGEGQKNWKWCNKCQGMAYAGGSPGKCQADGNHDYAGSGNYTLCLNGDPKSLAHGQDQWRRCNKCQLLCFDGHTSCPAGGPHISVESGNYELNADNPSAPTTQKDWKWCKKCYGLSFSANLSNGTCPRGGTHDHSDSANYSLLMDVESGGQNGWAWCHFCQQLWYSGIDSGRCCHAPIGGHTKSGSADYTLPFAS